MPMIIEIKPFSDKSSLATSNLFFIKVNQVDSLKFEL